MIVGIMVIAALAGLAALVCVVAFGGSVLQAIVAYSAVGSVTLVAAAIVAAVRRGPSDEAAATAGSESVSLPRLLAVDDDPAVRLLVAAALADTGIADVTFAASGTEALALVQAPDARFDAVLIDIMMPKMDGIELCRHLRAYPATQSVPLIMLTARRDLVHVSRAFAAGADDYVLKPFNAAELALLVRSLSRDGQRAAAQAEPSFEAPKDLGSIPGFLRSDAAENFLLRQRVSDQPGDPGTPPTIRAFALRIRDAAALYATLGDEAFETCLRRVGEALSAETPRAEAFLTYLGEGVFLFLPRRHVRIDAAALARRTNARLERVATTDSRQCAQPLVVDVVSTQDVASATMIPALDPQGKDDLA